MKRKRNMRDIKTREHHHFIKTKNKKENMKHFVKKNQVLKKKRNDIHKQNNEDYENEATNRVVDYEKKTAYDIQHYSKRIMQKRKIKNIVDKHDINEKSINNHLKNDKNESLMNSKILTVSNKKVKNERTTLFSDKANDHYHYQMKSHFISKHKNKIKELKQNTQNLKKTPSTGIKFFKGTVNVLKRSITGINQFITLGMGLILLIVITLFIGVFSALSDDSSVENGTMYVSTEVLSYTNIIEKYAKEYDIADYVPLIQAVMMQESGGKGNDPMQSSECPYNTKYPNVPNAIQDAEYSIDCGVHYLSDCIKRANVKSVSDMQNISLALQGYNFGNGYIEWAVEHFGGYTRANAKVFSDEMKAKLQVDVYGDPDYVKHVLRYYHIGNGDIVAVAKSQIGNIGGRKYWEWYGFDSHVEWCAIFVSWCANESGDLNTNIPKFSRVEDGIQWFKDNKKWADKNYKPKAGDLIFFDWNNDDDPDHVGIVESSDNQYIYTIEGNSNDECREKKYTLRNQVIIGCGIK